MIDTREMLASDRRFVVPTWARSSSYDGLALPERFRKVDRIIDGGARVIVLARGITVHAWACAEDDTLHYAYVPPKLRGHGLARRLIMALFGRYPERINVTHAWPGERERFRYTPHLIHREAA